MFYHSITVDMSNAMNFPEIGSFIGKLNSFLISEKVRYGFFNINATAFYFKMRSSVMKVAEKLLPENHTSIYQTQNVQFVRNSLDHMQATE